MAVQSSFATVSDQVILFNKNIIEVLAAINSLATTQDPSVTVNVYGTEGILTTYNLPSYAFLKNEIDRLNRSLNSLYSLDNANGSMIQPTNKNKFKKVITVDLNHEPNSVGELGKINQFTSDEDYFLDSLMNPALNIELDLSDKIDNNVPQVLIQRYIVNFVVDSSGTFTTVGSSALSDFNSNYNGKSNIDYKTFLNWYSTTPGILDPLNPSYDQSVLSLEPNSLLYSGLFTPQSTYLDSLNRKLWYNFPSIAYTVNLTGEVLNLKVGDQLVVNTDQVASTRYSIIEVDLSSSTPRLRFETLEGNQPVPVGIVGGLKIYSPVLYTKKVKIPIGYNERSVVFVKPLNSNNLLSKDWSLGSGFYTNDLTLKQNGPDNGKSFETYYINTVDDYGQVLKDLVLKNKPSKFGQAPNPVSLDPTAFKVVQVNTHLTDTPDSNLLKTKHNYQQALKSEVQQIDQAILDRNKKMKVTRFTSQAQQQQFQLELTNLQNQKVSKSNLLSTTTQEIIDLSKQPVTTTKPEFALRGFWNFPDPVTVKGTQPQQTIGFIIWYRRLSKDGKEPQISTYPLTDTAGDNVTAAYSNWHEIKTPVLSRTFDSVNGIWSWTQSSVTSADSPNINQVSIPIQANEQIEIKIKSVSEVGYPDAPLLSDWSSSVTIAFPDDLNSVINQNSLIINEANKEDLKSSVNTELNSRGLDDLLSQKTVVNNQTYFLGTPNIITTFKDTNGTSVGLEEQLKAMMSRIAALEEKISQSKGILQISVFRNNQEFVINNGSDTTFNVDCEDYLDPFVASGVPTGRVYQNSVYTIKDFIVKIANTSTSSPLGLLSNRTYLGNAQIYNTSVPQVFWINNQDELIISNNSGQTSTQLDYQFLWSINYDTVNQTTVTNLSQNIGNNFVVNGNNSLTTALSSPEFNLGYAESSILNFVSNNVSMLDPGKWVDTSVTVGSTTKFLTSIHPVVSDLTQIQETNYDKVHTLNNGDQNNIVVPLNIYFKMNALDTTQTGINYQYVNLNNSTQTVQHIKKIKFFLENQADNRPFIFTLTFNLNRNKINVKKNLTYNTIVK